MKQRIALIGTGLSGLTMAAALAHHGFDIALVGPDLAASSDARSTAILAPNVDFLESIGLRLFDAATPLRRMELIDGGEIFSFDCSEMDLPEFGFNVANDTLKASLLKAVLKNRRIAWRKTSLQSAKRTPDGWTLKLADKTILDTQLLIGADGRHSAVRAASAIACDTQDRNQAALVVTLKAEKPHRNVTVERYRSGGPFTLVPHTQNRLALVWCDDTDLLAEKIKLPPKALAAEITAISENRFGTLHCEGAAQLWPLRPMKAEKLVAPHTALIGEAAHVLPPIGAQGFNAGLSDIAALTRALSKGRSLGLPVHDFALLEEYERARRADIAARYHGITRLNDLIRAESSAAQKIRRLALRGATKIAPVKKILMRLGMGEAA